MRWWKQGEVATARTGSEGQFQLRLKQYEDRGADESESVSVEVRVSHPGTHRRRRWSG